MDPIGLARVARLLSAGVLRVPEPRPESRRLHQLQVRLSEGQAEALVAQYRGGLTFSAVAASFGVHPDTAAHYIRLRGGRHAAGSEIAPVEPCASALARLVTFCWGQRRGSNDLL
jgi:hypothetical protein